MAESGATLAGPKPDELDFILNLPGTPSSVSVSSFTPSPFESRVFDWSLSCLAKPLPFLSLVVHHETSPAVFLSPVRRTPS